MTEEELPKIKGYKIDKHIAIGENSNIYHAYDVLKKREVALKILNIVDKDRSLVSKFAAKFKINFRAKSENLIQFYDINTTDKNKIFFVMEYLDGECLSNVLLKKKLSSEEILNIIIQIGSVLRYAHNKGVYHKDLSPKNVFICKNNIIKVLDFGLVDFTGNYNKFYMSPEIYFKQQIDNRSDLYSFGLLIYEMITGHKAIKSQKDSYLINWHKKSRIPDVWLIDKTIPSLIRNTLLTMLSKNPINRYQNVNSFLVDIEKGYAEGENDNQDYEKNIKEEEIQEYKFPIVDMRKRFAAFALDLIMIIGFHAFMFQSILLLLNLISYNEKNFIFSFIFSTIFIIIIFLLYFTIFEFSKVQATPGKLLMKLKVTDTLNNKIDLNRSLKRNSAKLLSIPILFIVFFLTMADENGKSLHDKYSGTIVMNK